MKVAQVVHSWRRVSEDWESEHAFSGLAVAAERGFEESDVTLSGGACIIAGVNSGGKSRLIRSIFGEFNSPEPTFTSVSWKKSPPANAVLVDFFELLLRQAKHFDIVDLDDLLDSVGPSPLSQKKVDDISWVLGRQYKRIEIAELENQSLGEGAETAGLFRPEVFPYFTVTHESDETFGSESLSRGELAVLTLSWVLDSLTPGSLYLLDEPDLMLSPHSSARAIDLLINKLNDIKAPAFIATHSYHTLVSVPQALLVHINVGLEGFSVVSRPDDGALWKTLKVAAPLKAIFVVEDDAAKSLLSAILASVSPSHHELSEIWIAGDASKVVKAGQFPHSKGQTLEIWGVLDGNEPKPKRNDNVLKLPGSDSPEAGALRILKAYPQSCNIDSRRANGLLAHSAGEDPHDRARTIAKALGRNHISFTVETWMWWFGEVAEGQQALRDFEQELVSRVVL